MRELRATLFLAVCLAVGLVVWTNMIPEDRPVFPFAGSPDLTALALENRHGSIRLQRHGKTWRRRDPLRRCDDDAVTALLSPLAAFRGSPVAPVGELVHGLRSPAATLRWKAGSAEGSLLLGAATPSAERRYVSTGPASPVWALPLETAAPLLGPPASFRSLAPCPLSSEAVRGFEVRDRSITRRLERAEDGTWLVRVPFFARARPGPVREVLQALPSLRASAVSTECPGTELGSWGLDRPNVRLRAWDAAGEELLRLDLGRRLPRRSQEVWIRSSLDPAVFTCEARRLLFLTEDVLRLHPADLLAVPKDAVRVLELELDGGSWGWSAGRATAAEERKARRIIDLLAALPVDRVIEGGALTDEELGLHRPRGRLRIAGNGFDHRHVIGTPVGEWIHLSLPGRVLRCPTPSLEALRRRMGQEPK